MTSFPFIRDLNPKQDDLAEIVRIIKRHEGDNEAIAGAIKSLFDKGKTRRNYSLHSIKANTMASLRDGNLGIMTRDGHLTDFGKALLSHADKAGPFKDAVALHLLEKKGGGAFCRALKAVAPSQGSRRQSISAYLSTQQGIGLRADLNDISSMHSFLEWAGVCSNYRLNDARFQELTGVSESELKAAEKLSPKATLLLGALVRLGGSAAPGNLRLEAKQLSGQTINPHEMPAFGRELRDKGLIRLPEKRGSKTKPWRLANKQKVEVLTRFTADLYKSAKIPDDAFKYTFGELLRKIDKTRSTDTKGRLLEYLAARMCWRLGLKHIEIRHLVEYEVDLSAELTEPVFQKWIMQCKATQSPLASHTVLREYGIAELENIPVIVFVTTSSVSKDAQRTVDRIMERSNKTILIFDGRDLKALAQDEEQLRYILRKQSEHAREVKSSQRPSGLEGALAQAKEAQEAEGEDEE